ncbi:hypothetical protein MMPV_009017 [Pyropia vietnamensis]
MMETAAAAAAAAATAPATASPAAAPAMAAGTGAAAAAAAAAAATAMAATAEAAAVPPLERLTAPEDIAKASALLAGGQLFRNVSADHLAHLASRMTVRRLEPGEEFVAQGAPSTACYVLASGTASRSRVTWDGQRHVVDPAAFGTTINSLHAVRGDAAFASAACASPEGCTAWVLGRDELLAALASRPELGVEMVGGLAAQVRAATKRMRTPLLELPPPALSVPAVACAAAVESYYRSALNALLNARLAGGGATRGSLFPNMHVQVPARVAYIVGFKGLRVVLDREVHPEQHSHPDFVRFATMVAPGVLMTPVSSILEACNAGHANPEPLLRRSTRGILPRCGREVLFGVGLNQLSDYFEERARSVTPSPVAANLAGSLTAGVIAGYLSHVPHNLSTYKLMEPGKSYAELFRKFVDTSVREEAIPAFLSGRGRAAARVGLAVLFPRGVVIRTAQIVGSFAILNGIINGMQAAEQKRITAAMREAAVSQGGGRARSLPRVRHRQRE